MIFRILSLQLVANFGQVYKAVWNLMVPWYDFIPNAAPSYTLAFVVEIII